MRTVSTQIKSQRRSVDGALHRLQTSLSYARESLDQSDDKTVERRRMVHVLDDAIDLYAAFEKLSLLQMMRDTPEPGETGCSS